MSQCLAFLSLSNQKIVAFSEVFQLLIQHLFSVQADLDLAQTHRIYLNSPSEKIKHTHFTFWSISLMNTLGLILFVYFESKAICLWFWNTTDVFLQTVDKQNQTTLSLTLIYLTFLVCTDLSCFSKVWGREFFVIALSQKDCNLLRSWTMQIVSKKRGLSGSQIWTM